MNALEFLKAEDCLEDVEELQSITKKEITDYFNELDYCVRKRKIFEKDAPVGHLVIPTYYKLKNRSRSRKSVISRAYARALRKVIDYKAGRGRGKKTCMGGILDDIHYIQAYLNPLYKNLSLIGVSSEKVREIHSKVDAYLDGLKIELPDMFLGHSEDKEQQSDESEASDSDKDLFVRNTQRQRVSNTERQKWLKYKHDEIKLREYKNDSTPFWECTGRKLFPGHAILYYRFAPKHPSECSVERFFSVSGFLTKYKRGRTSMETCKAVTLRHLWNM